MLLLDESFWEVKESPIQGSGRRNRGIFSKKDISAGTVIGDYLGKVIRVKDEEKYEKGKDFYLMFYHRGATIYPDPKKIGIHLLNHSCTPNVWMYTYRGHTLYFALRHIFPGEELTVSYLLSPQDKDCAPCEHICECNGVICYHTMHMSQKKNDAWNDFEEARAKKDTREPISYGKQLPKLSAYPENIPDHPIYSLFGASSENSHIVENKTLPSKVEIRKIIRETGRTLKFPYLNIQVFGIDGDVLITKPLS